jgi:hypothetical protein
MADRANSSVHDLETRHHALIDEAGNITLHPSPGVLLHLGVGIGRAVRFGQLWFSDYNA